MASRFFAIGTLAVLTTVAAVAAVTAVATMRHPHLRPAPFPGQRIFTPSAAAAPGRARRRPAQNSTVRSRICRVMRRWRGRSMPLEDLRSIAPAVRFQQRSGDAAPLVLIDAVTRGDPQQLKAALVALGLKHPAVYSNDVGGWLPVTQLRGCSGQGRSAFDSRVHVAHSQWSRNVAGRFRAAQRCAALRQQRSRGAGVTVGVLSDSYDCYAVYAANNVVASGAAGYANNGFLATAADGCLDRRSAGGRQCARRSRGRKWRLHELRRTDPIALHR